MRVLLVLALCVFASSAQAGVSIVTWTFETSVPAGNDVATFPLVINPEVGAGKAGGKHASASTDWSSPVGNGSLRSFSSNNWATGDYYEFMISSVGFEGIQVSFDQTRSSTGSDAFKIAYSIDGATFTDFASYGVNANTWSSGSVSGSSQFSFDLSGVPVLDNDSSIHFRLIATAGASDTAGTVRVDNFSVQGSPSAAAVPEPSTLTMFGIGILGFAGAALRRRKRAA